MKKKYLTLILIMACIILTASCSGEIMTEQTNPLPGLKDIPDSDWQRLSNKKIYFGHQSVGFNILEGIEDLMTEYPQIKLNIVKTSDPSDFDKGIFAHSGIGQNMNTDSKNKDFISIMEDGVAKKADFAFFKYCYIDINSNSDIESIFSKYKNTVNKLSEKYNNVKFIHITAPLMSKPSGIKDWIKIILGRSIKDDESNIKRHNYNEMLRNYYKGKEPVFDLAEIESTNLLGKRVLFEKNNKKYYRLVSEYTDDGGHLNEKGRKMVAEQLLIFLSNLD